MKYIIKGGVPALRKGELVVGGYARINNKDGIYATYDEFANMYKPEGTKWVADKLPTSFDRLKVANIHKHLERPTQETIAILVDEDNYAYLYGTEYLSGIYSEEDLVIEMSRS